jgi:hypothetical protein
MTTHDGLPLGTFPRRVSVRSADGRRWDVQTSARETVATSPGGTVAGATIQDRDERVVIQFWTSPALPRELRAQLVEATFAHPAIRGRRPVLLSVPVGDSEVLVGARNRLEDPCSRVAGSTCLIEGLVPATAGADTVRIPSPRSPQ